MSGVIPVKNKIFTQPFVVVGCLIEKDGKFLLVQEGKVEKGKWNQPAGWLDLNEDIISGAKREAWEETGLDLEITGFLGIYSSFKILDGQTINSVKLVFAAKPLSDKLNYPQDEILDARWFTFEEIKQMRDKLRSQQIILVIEDYLKGKIYPMDVIKPFVDYTQK
jgi:8-oxo-dGTP pyrophosphatase MutT (NUDIX family)